MCVCVYVRVCVFSYPTARANMTAAQFIKQSLPGLNSKFSFTDTVWNIKVKNPSLSCYLPKTRGEIVESIFFVSILALCENINKLVQDLN